MDNSRLFAAQKAAAAAAEEANKAKSEFLARMSHDLRTPLNAIGGYAQLIELGVHGPVTDGQRDSAQRIIRAQKHLLSLISDILHFAKAESGQVPLQLRPVSLSSLCEELGALIGKQATDRGVTYRCDLDAATDGEGRDLMVMADTERVLRVLVNLLTNAIKFTDAGGCVVVKARRDGQWAEIVVRDNGRGIAAEHLERIFEPFVQVSGASDPRTSVGLGLATSRTIARRMGGDIVVESAPGAGSSFLLRLPTP
jgi:signal transduction histidine kinase